MSNNVPPQSKFPIVDLESGTGYELRVTAYNNAGSTQAEYLFSTLSSNGNNRLHEDHPHESETTPPYLDALVLVPSVISMLAVIVAIAGVCLCIKPREYAFTRRKLPSPLPLPHNTRNSIFHGAPWRATGSREKKRGERRSEK